MRRLVGSVVGVLTSVALAAAMLPLRSHLSIATAALVLVVPVVAGSVIGGIPAGLCSVSAGFVVYDLFYVPPYGTLSVGSAQNWVALGVYVVVMALVARVVTSLEEARRSSRRRADSARHLFELSELLLADRPLPDLGQTFANSTQEAFGLEGVALLVPADGRLEVVASAGTPLSPDELSRLNPEAHVPVALLTASSGPALQTIALWAAGPPVGLLVLRGVPEDRSIRELLPIVANHLALALERAQLHERAVQVGILEEVDRLRRALVGAVSHDLRTPLATMKVAASTLADPTIPLDTSEVRELGGLIELQTDRLTRLVANLLDMTRIHAGVLEVHRLAWSVLDLVGETLAGIRPSLGDRRVEVDLPESLPPVDVDHLLIGQVLANLLDNANRHGPPGTPLSVAGAEQGDRVTLSVSDEGPGVPAEERQSVFESFRRFDTGGRAGLGLAIAKTFVEAHGERIWVEEAPGGGARFVFTLPRVRRSAPNPKRAPSPPTATPTPTPTPTPAPTATPTPTPAAPPTSALTLGEGR